MSVRLEYTTQIAQEHDIAIRIPLDERQNQHEARICLDVDYSDALFLVESRVDHTSSGQHMDHEGRDANAKGAPDNLRGE